MPQHLEKLSRNIDMVSKVQVFKTSDNLEKLGTATETWTQSGVQWSVIVHFESLFLCTVCLFVCFLRVDTTIYQIISASAFLWCQTQVNTQKHAPKLRPHFKASSLKIIVSIFLGEIGQQDKVDSFGAFLN